MGNFPLEFTQLVSFDVGNVIKTINREFLGTKNQNVYEVYYTRLL